MADLIQEFFERELSEAEANSLGNLLQESPDSALRFESLLEKHYLQTGLPLPQLPASLNDLPRVPKGFGSLGGMKVILLLAAAGLGYLTWKYWQAKTEVPLQAPLPEPVLSAPAIAKKLATLQAVIPLPVLPQEVGPSAEGEELSVVVDAPRKALVTVRILDSAGKEVRALYTGFIEAGHWDFKWDGDLTNGAPAPAGNYQIDVQSGISHQTKDVRIKPN